MFNKVILIGRLCADPELKYTPSGAPVARFTLAVDRGRKNQQGEKETDFIRCSTWNKQAEIVANYVQKGRLIAIEGRLRIDTVEDQQGNRRTYTEVVVNSLTFLPGQQQQSGGDFSSFGTEVDPHSDDVPFN